MTSYETLFIVHPNMTEEEVKPYIEKVTGVIETAGTVTEIEEWGKKRLAYEIDDIAEGLYVLVTFSAEPKTVKELDRVMKITDEILRHMIIRKGE